MRYLFVLQTKVVFSAAAIGCILPLAMAGSLVAQTTGAVNPKPVAAPSEKDYEPPAGGCMPIGVTASGDVVFPLQCKDFIERLRTADQKTTGEKNSPGSAEPSVGQASVVTEQAPVVKEQAPIVTEEKMPEHKDETLATENGEPEGRPVVKVPLENRIEREPRQRVAGPPGCSRFRSYDPASKSYRSYDGRRLSCQVVDQAAIAK